MLISGSYQENLLSAALGEISTLNFAENIIHKMYINADLIFLYGECKHKIISLFLMLYLFNEDS